MEYVTYNETGKLTGSYSQGLLPEHAACYIEVTATQRANWTSLHANAARNGVEDIGVTLPPTSAEMIASRCVESDALAAAKRNAIVAGISPAEMASWPMKLAEAVKFAVSNDPADAPYLAAEATARGITLSALVAKVQTNGATLASLEAEIAGINGRHKDALAAMTSTTDVLAYDITADYPA